MAVPILVQVRLGSDELEQVWNLYRKNSNTLGFLPRGALEEFTHAGHVLALVIDAAVLGYLAWRRSKGEIVIVHLCIAEEHRRTDFSEILLKGLLDQCEEESALRLRCRKDYVGANRVWPKFGFVVVDEVVGRGAAAQPLLVWRRAQKGDAPLLRAIDQVIVRAGRVVAIDANVFFDTMDSTKPHHEESSALLADWIDDVEICVTSEIRNEISRGNSLQSRKNANSHIARFREIFCPSEDLQQSVEVVSREGLNNSATFGDNVASLRG